MMRILPTRYGRHVQLLEAASNSRYAAQDLTFKAHQRSSGHSTTALHHR